MYSIMIPLRRYLVFIDWQKGSENGSPASTVIKRCEMDGSDLRTIVNSSNAGSASDLVIDYQGVSLVLILLMATLLSSACLLMGAYIRWCLLLMGAYRDAR